MEEVTTTVQPGAKESSMFDKLYENAKEAMKSITKPFAKGRIRRLFEASYDAATNDKIEATDQINKIYEKFDTFDKSSMEKIIELRQRIADAEEVQKFILAEYKTLFGKDLNVEVEE